jgi:hypothetical protein
MTITHRPRWSLGRGKAVVPSRWQATAAALDIAKATVLRVLHEANVQMRPTGAHY